LLAGLLLAAALAPPQLQAQTNSAKAVPSSQRWLLIVETSRSMQRRADGVSEAVRDLLISGMAGQMHRGDTLGVWTFNDDLYAGRLPLQRWSPEAQGDIASRTLAFLKAQKYEKQANFDKVLPALVRVIKGSALITVILISSGDEKMRGTPFDDRINEFYQKWRDQQQKARMPFLTVLRAKAGQLADYTINTPPWPTQMPRLSRETQSAETIQRKLLEALHNDSSPTGLPLVVSGKQTPPATPPPPQPQPGVVKVGPPAPAALAPGTNNLLAARPPAPAVPPVTAQTRTAPLTPAKPPAATPPPQPPPARPTPAVVEPPKPAPAPEPKPALAPVPAPAPPPTPEVSVSGPRPGLPSLAPPPSSIPTPPAQTATAVPGDTLARHRNIWIAVLVFIGVVVSFSFLRLRRGRAAPGASLITRSFERKNKP
jgi:hypothetical protein